MVQRCAGFRGSGGLTVGAQSNVIHQAGEDSSDREGSCADRVIELHTGTLSEALGLELLGESRKLARCNAEVETLRANLGAIGPDAGRRDTAAGGYGGDRGLRGAVAAKVERLEVDVLDFRARVFCVNGCRAGRDCLDICGSPGNAVG